MRRSKSHQPDLIERLRDAREAEEYLTAALEKEGSELLLLELRNVAEAQGGKNGLRVEKSGEAKKWGLINQGRK